MKFARSYFDRLRPRSTSRLAAYPERPRGATALAACGDAHCRTLRVRPFEYKAVLPLLFLLILFTEPEHSHRTRQAGRLLLHGCRCGCRLLDQRRILLRDLIHLYDRLVDLLDAGSLLAAGHRDFTDYSIDARHAADDLFHGRPGLRGQPIAGIDLLAGIFYQTLDFLGRCRTTLRQRPHFSRHHRESASMLAGTRRFDRRVQSENIGLK